MPRNRVLALAFVGAFLGLLRWVAPAPAERAVWLYLVALPLGYGHVIGAAAFSRSRWRGSGVQGTSRWLVAAFVGSSLLTLLVAYTWALRSTTLQPFALAPILLLFGWHIVENDLAMGRSYADGLHLGPVARRARQHAVAFVFTAVVALAAFSTREGALFSRVYFGTALLPVQPWLTLDELSAGFLLYHTVSWLLFFEDRARALYQKLPAEAVRLRRRVLAFHGVPLLLNAALYFWLPSAYVYVAAPALYFLWSSVHAIHTAWVRGLEPRPAPA
jgi:hypothetical protein